MKLVFGILTLITFLLIGIGFGAGAVGDTSWAALCMTGAVISGVFAACAATDLLEYNPRRRRVRR